MTQNRFTSAERRQRSPTAYTNPENAWHMSKAGNSRLPPAAYRMAVVGVRHNPVIAAHHARKRFAGKSKMNALRHWMNALRHCMRKALTSSGASGATARAFDPR